MALPDTVLVIGGCVFILVGVALIQNAWGSADRAARRGREIREMSALLDRVLHCYLLSCRRRAPASGGWASRRS